MGSKKSKSSKGSRVAKWINLIFSFLGIAIASYSLFVELKKHADPSYEPFCDLHAHVSCSKAFMSEYGKGFGLVAPLLGEHSILNQFNSLYGIIAFGVISMLGVMGTRTTLTVQKWLLIFFNLSSVYLWVILTFILKTVCVVCYSVYIVNAVLLITNLSRLRGLASGKSEKRH